MSRERVLAKLGFTETVIIVTDAIIVRMSKNSRYVLCKVVSHVTDTLKALNLMAYPESI